MHSELIGRRLAELAEFEPPAGGWRAVLAARDARETRLDLRWPLALAAAALIAAVGIAARLQSAQEALDDGSVAVRAPVAAEMRAENERLESILAQLPERRAMRGSTAFTVAELEDRLALLDDRLSRVALEPNAPERAERLWRQRVDVMHTLVQVRYADAIGGY
ncbi:MAG: hypothetical protein FJ171_06315 [Gammaproteobacteria bacterium]|nr:hypothetical protein [Gammaproteobacteria bacterium]